MRLTLFILLFLPYFVFGQSNSIDTVYYAVDRIVATSDSAVTVRYIEYNPLSERYEFEEWLIMELSHDGLVQKGELKSIDPEIKDGVFSTTDVYGNSVKTKYSANSFVDIIAYANDDGLPIDPIYFNGVVDEPATYPGGGEKFFKVFYNELNTNKSQEKFVTNTKLNILFIIEPNGSTSNFRVMNGIEKNIDKEACDVISKLIFIPAKHRGENVRTSMIIPLHVEIK